MKTRQDVVNFYRKFIAEHGNISTFKAYQRGALAPLAELEGWGSADDLLDTLGSCGNVSELLWLAENPGVYVQCVKVHDQTYPAGQQLPAGVEYSYVAKVRGVTYWRVGISHRLPVSVAAHGRAGRDLVKLSESDYAGCCAYLDWRLPPGVTCLVVNPPGLPADLVAKLADFPA
jgi:hypothetical protein